MKRFVLAGNPNSGKTTLFNTLTGSTAHVGNWPGVTVDKREGLYKKSAEPISIVDLPGIYSLSPYTPEEVISRNFILDEKPDCVINIVDATNLERNLYLSTQLLEMDVPIVIALNMMDTLEKQGSKIDEKELEKRIGVPVVKVSALKEKGIAELMERAIETSKTPRKGKTVLGNSEISHLISDVRIALQGHDIENPLFHAIKLVENDDIEVAMHFNTVKMVEEFKKTYHNELFGSDLVAFVADARYKYITKNFSPLLKKKQSGIVDTPSDKADKILTHKWFGIPIFLLILFGIFHLAFSEDLFFLGRIFDLPTLDNVPKSFGKALLSCFYDGVIYSPGAILFNLMELLTSTLFGWITFLIAKLGASPAVLGLVGEGIFGGIGAVLSFVPQIVFLLLMLSLLEDTGYMARVAFILDKLFRKFGISGRAFIPMIMGFGCSVPAMVNTRTLKDQRERTMTLRVIPFFSCGAKLPILSAVAGAVGHICGLGDGSFIAYAMYVVGMLVAFVTIIIMHSTTQSGEVSPFIMELPAYHLPSKRSLVLLLWDKTKHYLEKVFTVILVSTIIIWFVSNFGWDWKMTEIENSILASLGKFFQPLFTPLGFGSQLGSFGWVFVVAAVTGLIAKENVIATIGTLSALFVAFSGEIGVEGAAEVVTMAQNTGITWQGLISFIVFNLTTIPCFAAVATAKGETPKGKFKWTLLFWIVSSYIASTITYLVLSWWWTSLIFIAIVILLIASIKTYNKLKGKEV